MKVWFITGASRGIGQAIAKAALAAGDCVVAASRTGEIGVEDSERLLSLKLDISNPDMAAYEAAAQAAVERFGRIDILVNNAGRGAVTNFEETDEVTIKSLYEVNVFGTMRMTRAVLPIMRKQRSGRIFNVASTAAYAPGPVIYHSSKFAVTGFSVALAFEVAPFGIKVTNVAPGMFRTSFYDKGTWGTEPDRHISDYDANRWQPGLVAECRKHQQPGDPDKLAKLILEVADTEKPPLHLAIGADGPQVLDAYIAQIKADTDAWREKAEQTSYES